MNDPKIYSNNHNIQRVDTIDILDKYLDMERIHENGVVLDIGCGCGDTTRNVLLKRLLTKNVKKLIGCDCSREMFDYARVTYTHAQLEFQQFDICESPANLRATIDHVFSFYCFHWIRDQKKAFENVYNLLSPKGDMLIGFLSYHQAYDVYYCLAKKAKWKQYMYDVREITSPYHGDITANQTAEKILIEIGFKVRICHVAEKKYDYSSIDDWKQTMQAVNPFVKRIPADLVSEHMTDMFNESKNMQDESFKVNDNGTVTIKYNLLIIAASKS